MRGADDAFDGVVPVAYRFAGVETGRVEIDRHARRGYRIARVVDAVAADLDQVAEIVVQRLHQQQPEGRAQEQAEDLQPFPQEITIEQRHAVTFMVAARPWLLISFRP